MKETTAVDGFPFPCIFFYRDGVDLPTCASLEQSLTDRHSIWTRESVKSERTVIRGDDSRRAQLEAEGWTVVAQSWAAQLSASNVDADALSALVHRGRRHGTVRDIIESDLPSVLALESATIADYPGGIATQHRQLSASTARVTSHRRGFGVFDATGRALAVTFVDVDGNRAETDFTVVAAKDRGRGIGSAVKAASLLSLLSDGVEVFRTGGASENTAILAANQRLGYVIDEEWMTLESPLQSVD